MDRYSETYTLGPLWHPIGWKCSKEKTKPVKKTSQKKKYIE